MVDGGRCTLYAGGGGVGQLEVDRTGTSGGEILVDYAAVNLERHVPDHALSAGEKASGTITQSSPRCNHSRRSPAAFIQRST